MKGRRNMITRNFSMNVSAIGTDDGKNTYEIRRKWSEKGKKAIRLDALASNIPAQHMYEKLGFAYRGKRNLYAENTGWTDFLYYELPISKEI